MAELTKNLIRRKTSALLANLSVTPVPSAPYLGGHLADAVEWDEQLVRSLLSLRTIGTALDVGCGLGLSLDHFAALGITCWGLEGNPRVLDGPCEHKERLLIVDFHKHFVEFPAKVDLVWCVETLEHIPPAFESNVVATIVKNAGELVFVAAASPGQPGYFHVNCRSRDYWIDRFTGSGLRYHPATDSLLNALADTTSRFGPNFIKRNGLIFEAKH